MSGDKTSDIDKVTATSNKHIQTFSMSHNLNRNNSRKSQINPLRVNAGDIYLFSFTNSDS